MKWPALFLFSATIALSVPVLAREKEAIEQRSPEVVEQFVRLQIFLDNANFGPGKIDGRDGEFTQKALALYRRSQGLQAPATSAQPGSFPDTAGLALESVSPVYVEYVITKEDAQAVGDLPGSPSAQAKVKSLPYATLEEAVAEKFHCDLDFLKSLNSGKELKEQARVLVPNVKPFEISAVKSLQPGSEAANLGVNEKDEEPAAAGSPPAEPIAKKAGAEEAPAKNPVSLHISTKESLIEVIAGERLVASFPVTIGSEQTSSPLGNWKVQAVAKMPNFRYDKKMLNEGERSSDFKMLPPGPNNPVGIMWIALNKKGIGIHGTNDPDTIGRASSHGCIRLANWDVVKLAELVAPGTPVTID